MGVSAVHATGLSPPSTPAPTLRPAQLPSLGPSHSTARPPARTDKSGQCTICTIRSHTARGSLQNPASAKGSHTGLLTSLTFLLLPRCSSAGLFSRGPNRAEQPQA